MPDYGGLKPIYQYYVDAVQSNARAQAEKVDMQINRIKGAMELYGLQKEIQERQIVQQAWGQDGGGFDQGAVGGSQPGANPNSGDDPSLQTAAKFDKIGQALMKVDPTKGMEWMSKASTLRDQYYTRASKKLTEKKTQNEFIVDKLGSLQPGDQQGYTNALMALHDAGVDISQLGLQGNLEADGPVIQKVVKQSMTFTQKLDAQKTAFTENIELNKFADQKRHEGVEEGQGNARIALEAQGKALQAAHNTAIERFEARRDAREQAGVGRTDAVDIAKLKDQVMRPTPGGADTNYAMGIVAADPALSKLSSDEKKAAAAEIQLTARKKLAERITKPTDPLPSADDFLNSMQIAAKGVAKRVATKKAGWFGKDTANLGARTVTANSRADFDALSVGDKFIGKDGKPHTKTSANGFDEPGAK